ncbi:sulfurtransferase TusA family protein [Vibrio ouci]|uniref:Sulfurtransferase TusA family protein n=1 Tax=Vibrio ouci TaxID=2499078 RepID=A0A4Y8WGI3_9VIBR|nr:sulfurtransferase TusA family protein [Vibrio ouci]TFH92040.1 sulfurtransferase TusA family protein [Vibrio ouci]
MEPNILDLRQERCPMALLLAKRHTKGLSVGEQTQILVSDSNSMKDITRFLHNHLFSLTCEEMNGYYRMQVIKEPS